MVALRLANGQRPQPPVDCPAVLAKLMEACWVPQVGHRPTSSELLKAIENISATGGALDTVEAEQSATTMIADDYDSFLESLQLADKRDALASCQVVDAVALVLLRKVAVVSWATSSGLRGG